jgi:flagella basal body P-ring formation protein FlgA
MISCVWKLFPAVCCAGVLFASDCRKVEGDTILGRDLAAANPAFAGAPPDAIFGFAPRPGVARMATAAQLKRFAREHGIEGTFEAMCFERATEPPDAGAATAAMRKSLGAPDAHIEIVEMSKFAAPPGKMVFPRESLAEPPGDGPAVWNGYVAYNGGRFQIWAKARIMVPTRRVVAAADLKAGQLLTENDVREETADVFPKRNAPLASAGDAVGHVARRRMAAGTPILASALGEPNVVERGQTVAVEVHSGGAVLKLEATAETAGHRGDTIPVRNVTSGKVFRARVEGKGLVILEFHAPEKTR